MRPRAGQLVSAVSGLHHHSSTCGGSPRLVNDGASPARCCCCCAGRRRRDHIAAARARAAGTRDPVGAGPQDRLLDNLSAVLAIEGPSRPRSPPAEQPPRPMAARHQVGCVAPCPPRGPLALATATGEDAARAACCSPRTCASPWSASPSTASRRVGVPADRAPRGLGRGKRRRVRRPGRERDGAGGATAAQLVALRGPRSRSGPSYWVDAVLARRGHRRARLLRSRPAGRRHRRAL